MRQAIHHDVKVIAARILCAAFACALVASCSTKSDSKIGTVTGETPVAEARAAASGREPDAEPPRESKARSIDGYKRDAARRVYFSNTTLLFDGAPPPVLKSLVVLSIRVDAKGAPQRVSVVRSNGYRDLEQRAMKSVHDAAPLPVPHTAVVKKGAVDYVETWLFRDDGRFQIRSLAGAQASIDAD
jgi:periplasmic protein TonB